MLQHRLHLLGLLERREPEGLRARARQRLELRPVDAARRQRRHIEPRAPPAAQRGRLGLGSRLEPAVTQPGERVDQPEAVVAVAGHVARALASPHVPREVEEVGPRRL